MFYSRKTDDAPAYPTVPNTLRSDSYEMTDVHKPQENRPDTAPTVTPYLSLRSRLSQIWMNRWTILLLLVLVRLVFLVADLNDNIGDAKAKALSSCTKVEDIGSAVASMPHYLSVGVNSMAASGIDKAVSGMVTMLDLVLTGVQALIIFYINFLIATYTCLITAMVHGSLEMVANATEDATELFNSVTSKAVKGIEGISDKLEEGLKEVSDKIESSVFGSLVPDFPKIDFSEPIKELKGFNLSADDFVKDVRKLNEDLPTFREVQNMTEEAISIPFDMVRKLVNETYGGYKFNRDSFPLAQKQQLSFCSDNSAINDFFKALYELVQKARIIFIVVLVIAAIAVMAPMAWLEIKRWRRQQQTAKLISEGQYDSMDVVYIASRPTTAYWGIKVASRFSGQRQILVRWCIAYATSPVAIFVLALAIAGFFSCFCQWLLIRSIQKEVPALAGQVGAFADEVVQSLEGVSNKWSTDANSVVTNLNDDINGNVLGWVTNATDAVNDTLTTFVDTMNKGLETVFNGTILIDPIKTVVYCVIGIKVETVQKGLTWVHDNAHVNFPMFDNDTFSMGAKDSVNGDSGLTTFLASPSSVTTDEVTGAVKHVVEWLHKKLIQDVLISLGLLLLYVIVVLFGVARTLAGMASHERGRAEGGMRFTGEDRPTLSPRNSPRAAAPPAFPRFGSSSAEVSTYTREPEGGNEKFMSGARTANATEVQGPERHSSYVHFDYDRKH